MEEQDGTVWLYGGRESKPMGVWEQLELPVLRDLTSAKPNDCVMMVSEKERGAKVTSTQKSPWLMNQTAAYVNALSRNEMERRLRREGVPASLVGADSSGTPITVVVWGHSAIEMRRSNPSMNLFNEVKYSINSWDKMFIAKEHPLWKPAERMAARAIYLLGLDYGRVDLILSEKGKLLVTGVTSELKPISEASVIRLRDAVRGFATAWAAEVSEGVTAKLGADPEFVMLSRDGRVVPASRYFTPEGDAGCDSVRIRGEKRWPLVELRPRPTVDPQHLTADLRRLLFVANDRTAGASLIWRAGALPVPGLPLGGHVHLSGATLTSERLRALDNAVALPLRLLEPVEAARRRPRYGSLGDVRSQPYGGFEYRTPPSWLVSPRLAFGTFALAKLAAEHSRELASDRPLDEERYREAFYAGDRELLLMAAARVHRSIMRTSTYAAHKEPIDFLFEAIARGRSWDEVGDFRLKWHIPTS
ncbi:putative amidoligase domain-containing protein [Cohnella mopanensis]|uniref:putative amidoligase domain-containing protein n=1 Tax=Cohnella mopanensis TaxID=2911966 RepID=UPI001EF841C7|nr:hypothetical protein [Cohnella mopanensis]